MEKLEFAGGKYRKAQLLSQGPLETYTAEQASTGRRVYCHRVSLSSDAAQPLVLLLATAMSRSESVRQRVVDAGEEAGYWYVVTVLEERCLALREWLQYESDHGKTPLADVTTPAPAPTEKREPGEFTRMVMRQQLRSKMNAQRPSSPAAGDRSEFTRFFSTPGEATEQKPAPNPQPSTPASSTEPGEFTVYFSKAPSSTVSGVSAATSATDFSTRFKGHQSDEGSMHSANVPGMNKPADGRESLFGSKAETPEPIASQKEGSSEFTRLFGPESVPPPRQPSAVAPMPSKSVLSDPLRPAPQTAPFSRPEQPLHSAPTSENSIAPGRMAAAGAGAGSPPPTASGSFQLPVQVNVSGSNPLSSMQGGSMPQFSAPGGNISPAGGSFNSPLGSVNVSGSSLPQAQSLPPLQAPSAAPSGLTDQKKIIIFFAILAILTVVLIAGVAVSQK